MTPLMPCLSCGEGIYVHRDGDPIARCGCCGAPEAPLVAGGQRTIDSALVAGVCLGLVGLIVLGCWIVSVVS